MIDFGPNMKNTVRYVASLPCTHFYGPFSTPETVTRHRGRLSGYLNTRGGNCINNNTEPSATCVTANMTNCHSPHIGQGRSQTSICWPILSILTATVFSCIQEFLLSCPRIRGGGRLFCLSLATALLGQSKL